MPTDIEDLADGFSPFAPNPAPAGPTPAGKKECKKRGPNKVGKAPNPTALKKELKAVRARAGGTAARKAMKELRLPVSALFDAASGLKVEDGKLCYAMIEQLQSVSKQSRRRIVNALNRIFS